MLRTHLHRVLLALAALAGLVATAASAQPGLPTAAVRNVPETFFGTVVDDPYRDFENIKSPAVAAWMKAHSEDAHKLLRSISCSVIMVLVSRRVMLEGSGPQRGH